MWRQPIPTKIPELGDNLFAENIFCNILRTCANSHQEIRMSDGTLIVLERGQCIFGRFMWNDMFGLPGGSQKIEKEIKKSPFLNRNLNRTTKNKYSILTVLNYDSWVTIEQEVKQQPNSNLTASKQQTNTHKSVKSVESEKNIPKGIGGKPPSYGNGLIDQFLNVVKQYNNGISPVDTSERKLRNKTWNILQLLGVRKGMKVGELPEDVRSRINGFFSWLEKEKANKNLTIERIDTLKLQVNNFLTNYNAKG